MINQPPKDRAMKGQEVVNRDNGQRGSRPLAVFPKPPQERPKARASDILPPKP